MKRENEFLYKYRWNQGDAFKASNEVAFLAEEVEYEGFIHEYELKGTFIIPALIPMMKSTEMMEEEFNGVTRYNYVKIPIPLHTVWKFVIKSQILPFDTGPDDLNLFINVLIPEGTEFILNFSGDDINRIRIIGVNERSSEDQ